MPSKTQSIIMGALVYAVLGIVIGTFLIGTPIGGALGCLILFAPGLIVVWHYTSTHGLTIPAGQGAGVGVITTMVGVLVSIAISFLLVKVGVMPDPAIIAEAQMDQAIADMESRGMSEEDIDRALSFGRIFTNPGIMLALGLVLGAIAGAISGAIGAVIFKKGGDSLAM